MVNILGTMYKVVENAGVQDEGCDGMCHTYTKMIELAPLNAMLSKEDSKEAKKIRYNEVKRHEIIHAFFAECGCDDWCNDERLVSFLAAQFPKLVAIFQDEECLT